MTSSLHNSKVSPSSCKFSLHHPPFSRLSPTIVEPFWWLKGAVVSWWAIGLSLVVFSGSTCDCEFSFSLGVISGSVFVSEDGLLLFKCRRFLLNPPPGVCTVQDLVAVPQLLLLTPLGQSPTRTLWVIRQATPWLLGDHHDSPSVSVSAACLLQLLWRNLEFWAFSDSN